MKINILGYGLMGQQIAALFYLGGFEVTIWNHRPVNENKIFKQINFIKNTLSNTKEGSIKFTNSIEELQDNITIEAIVENLDVKKNLYELVKSNVSKPYFTNTSSLSPCEISPQIGGIHFFNPLSVLKIVELYLPEKINAEEIKLIIDFIKSSEFEIIEVNPQRGYLGNYILFNEISTVFRLI